MNAIVADKREVAKGTLMVVFDLLGEEVDFQAGQYFFVNLIDPPFEDERGPRRHFSVVTPPSERGKLGFCTRIRDSGFKQSVKALSVGDKADVEPPKGNFLLPEDTTRELVFVAGGIGITVFRCMLHAIEDANLPYRVTLLYSNRKVEETPFLDELRELEARSDWLRIVLTMTEDEDWDGETRRIDEQFFRDYLGDRFDDVTYLVAGPPSMANAMKDVLIGAGVAEDRVRVDRFSGYD